MSWSLQQKGCTFCHNSRNFYAYEGATEDEFSQHNRLYGLNRLKGQQMLLMTTYLAQNWSRYVLPRTQPAVDVNQGEFVDYFYSALPTTENAKPVDRAAYVDRKYYIQVDQDESKTFLMPGCYTCHRESNIPKAAIREEGREMTEWDIESMTFAEDDIVTFPSVLRGQQ
jgi:photosynthetic reaction center cytochrome c subunit